MSSIALPLTLLGALALVLLSLYYADGKPPGRNPCEMSYMSPDYVKIPLFPVSSRYRLLRYTGDGNRALGTDVSKLSPVLFVPGNAGDYAQARTLGSQINATSTAVYTIDFRSQYTAWSGLVLSRQASFVKEAVDAISARHEKQRVTIVGHSMGALAAWPSALAEGSKVDRVFALCAPLARPTIALPHLLHFYEKYLQASPPEQFTLISIGCGRRDVLVPSSLSFYAGADLAHSLQLPVSALVNFSIDHQAILWCKQFSTRLARAVSGPGGKDLEAVSQALFAPDASSMMHTYQLAQQLAMEDMYEFTGIDTLLDVFVFALRVRWTRLIPLTFAALCLAVRERAKGWFLPNAITRLIHTSFSVLILPFAFLLEEFWVSLWLFAAALAAVSIALYVCVTLAQHRWCLCGVRKARVRERVVFALLALGGSISLGGFAVVGLDMAFLSVYFLLSVVALFWLVAARGKHASKALLLLCSLFIEVEALLFSWESIQVKLRVKSGELKMEENVALIQSIALLLPWLALFFLLARRRAPQRVAPQPEPAPRVEQVVEQRIEATAAAAAVVMKAGTSREAFLTTLPFGEEGDVLEFHSDLHYEDRKSSRLVVVSESSKEVVQVDDLVCKFVVEKDVNAVSIVNPTIPRHKDANASPAEEEEDVVRDADQFWPKWTVWSIQLVAVFCLVRADDALPLLNILAAGVALVLCRIAQLN